MTIQPIGPSGACVYCDAQDLAAWGTSPGSITPEQALRLVRQVLGRAVPVSRVELYPDPLGAMIFAQLEPGRAPRPPILRPRRRGRVRRRST